MPIFEYDCAQCRNRFILLVGVVAQPASLVCPKCGATEIAKRVSRFARLKSEDQRVDEMADRLESVGEPDSPSAMRAMMKEMGKAMDDDASEEMEEVFEADMEGKLDDEE